MKLYIATDEGSYGICTPDQIKAVQTRMEIIASELGIDTEHHDCQMGDPEDSHELSEAIFEAAMGCATHIKPPVAAATIVADRECPLPEN